MLDRIAVPFGAARRVPWGQRTVGIVDFPCEQRGTLLKRGQASQLSTVAPPFATRKRPDSAGLARECDPVTDHTRPPLGTLPLHSGLRARARLGALLSLLRRCGRYPPPLSWQHSIVAMRLGVITPS